MASDGETSCISDPNFAVICSFFENFGTQLGLKCPDFLELQEMLDNSQELSPELVDLHLKLLRKVKKSVSTERWEKALVKVCHTFSSQDAWEVERFGYKKARTSSKVRILKSLLEMQFDNNVKFKSEVNKLTSKELRSQPLGRDKNGNYYWYLIDDQCQIRVYREDPDEETWTLVVKDREELVELIKQLSSGEIDCKDLDSNMNEDSNSLEIEKPITDTGQVAVEGEESSVSIDEIKKEPSIVSHNVDNNVVEKEEITSPKEESTTSSKEELKEESDLSKEELSLKEESTSMKEESTDSKESEEKVLPENSEIEPDKTDIQIQKPEIQKIRLSVKNYNKDNEEVGLCLSKPSDVMDLTSKKKKSINDLAADLRKTQDKSLKYMLEERGINLSIVKPKLPTKPFSSNIKLPDYEDCEDDDDDDFDDSDEINLPSHMKQPRLDRPKLLGNKKQPSTDEEDEEYDDEIKEPVMYFQGEGSGNDCNSENVKDEEYGEEIEEDVMFFYGEGSGRDCETGNEKPDEKNAETTKTDNKEDILMSPTNKIGKVVFDSDNKVQKNDKSPKKLSRWDVKTDSSEKSEESIETDPNSSNLLWTGKVKSLISQFEEISSPSSISLTTNEADPPAPKKMFFFGPQSMKFSTCSAFFKSLQSESSSSDTDLTNKVPTVINKAEILIDNKESGTNNTNSEFTLEPINNKEELSIEDKAQSMETNKPLELSSNEDVSNSKPDTTSDSQKNITINESSKADSVTTMKSDTTKLIESIEGKTVENSTDELLSDIEKLCADERSGILLKDQDAANLSNDKLVDELEKFTKDDLSAQTEKETTDMEEKSKDSNNSDNLVVEESKTVLKEIEATNEKSNDSENIPKSDNKTEESLDNTKPIVEVETECLNSKIETELTTKDDTNIDTTKINEESKIKDEVPQKPEKPYKPHSITHTNILESKKYTSKTILSDTTKDSGDACRQNIREPIETDTELNDETETLDISLRSFDEPNRNELTEISDTNSIRSGENFDEKTADEFAEITDSSSLEVDIDSTKEPSELSILIEPKVDAVKTEGNKKLETIQESGDKLVYDSSGLSTDNKIQDETSTKVESSGGKSQEVDLTINTSELVLKQEKPHGNQELMEISMDEVSTSKKESDEIPIKLFKGEQSKSNESLNRDDKNCIESTEKQLKTIKEAEIKNKEETAQNQEVTTENKTETTEHKVETKENKVETIENKDKRSTEEKEDTGENKGQTIENKDVIENKEDIRENKEDITENKEDITENKGDTTESKGDDRGSKSESKENKNTIDNKDDTTEKQEKKEDMAENKDESKENQETIKSTEIADNKMETIESKDETTDSKSNIENQMEISAGGTELETTVCTPETIDTTMVEEEKMDTTEIEANTIETTENKVNNTDNMSNITDNKMERTETSSEIMENKMNTTENKLETAENKIETVENKTAEDKLETTEPQLETNENKMETMEGTSEAMVIKLQTGENQLEVTENKLETTKNQLETSDNKLETTENQLEADKDALGTNTLGISGNKLKITEKNMDTIENKLEITENKLEITESKLETSGNRLEIPENKLETTVNKLDVIESELDDKENKLDDKENKLEAKENKLEITENKLEVTESKSGTTEHNLETSGSRLETPENKLGNTGKKLGDIESKLADKENKLEVKENKLDDAENKLEVTENKLEATENKLEITENKLEVTENKLEITENKLESTESKMEITEIEIESKSDGLVETTSERPIKKVNVSESLQEVSKESDSQSSKTEGTSVTEHIIKESKCVENVDKTKQFVSSEVPMDVPEDFEMEIDQLEHSKEDISKDIDDSKDISKDASKVTDDSKDMSKDAASKVTDDSKDISKDLEFSKNISKDTALSKDIPKETSSKKVDDTKDVSKESDDSKDISKDTDDSKHISKDDSKDSSKDIDDSKNISKDIDDSKDISNDTDDSKDISEDTDDSKDISKDTDNTKNISKDADDSKNVLKDEDDSKAVLKDSDESQGISEGNSRGISKDKDSSKGISIDTDDSVSILKDADDLKVIPKDVDDSRAISKNISDVVSKDADVSDVVSKDVDDSGVISKAVDDSGVISKAVDDSGVISKALDDSRVIAKDVGDSKSVSTDIDDSKDVSKAVGDSEGVPKDVEVSRQRLEDADDSKDISEVSTEENLVDTTKDTDKNESINKDDRNKDHSADMSMDVDTSFDKNEEIATEAAVDLQEEGLVESGPKQTKVKDENIKGTVELVKLEEIMKEANVDVEMDDENVSKSDSLQLENEEPSNLVEISGVKGENLMETEKVIKEDDNKTLNKNKVIRSSEKVENDEEKGIESVKSVDNTDVKKEVESDETIDKIEEGNNKSVSHIEKEVVGNIVTEVSSSSKEMVGKLEKVELSEVQTREKPDQNDSKMDTKHIDESRDTKEVNTVDIPKKIEETKTQPNLTNEAEKTATSIDLVINEESNSSNEKLVIEEKLSTDGVNEGSSTTHVSPSMSDGPILCDDNTSNEANSIPIDADLNNDPLSQDEISKDLDENKIDIEMTTDNKENVMPTPESKPESETIRAFASVKEDVTLITSSYDKKDDRKREESGSSEGLKEIITIEEIEDDIDEESVSAPVSVISEEEESFKPAEENPEMKTVPEIKISEVETISIEELPPQEQSNIPPEMILDVKSPNIETLSDVASPQKVEDNPKLDEIPEGDEINQDEPKGNEVVKDEVEEVIKENQNTEVVDIKMVVDAKEVDVKEVEDIKKIVIKDDVGDVKEFVEEVKEVVEDSKEIMEEVKEVVENVKEVVENVKEVLEENKIKGEINENIIKKMTEKKVEVIHEKPNKEVCMDIKENKVEIKMEGEIKTSVIVNEIRDNVKNEVKGVEPVTDVDKQLKNKTEEEEIELETKRDEILDSNETTPDKMSTNSDISEGKELNSKSKLSIDGDSVSDMKSSYDTCSELSYHSTQSNLDYIETKSNVDGPKIKQNDPTKPTDSVTDTKHTELTPNPENLNEKIDSTKSDGKNSKIIQEPVNSQVDTSQLGESDKNKNIFVVDDTVDQEVVKKSNAQNNLDSTQDKLMSKHDISMDFSKKDIKSNQVVQDILETKYLESKTEVNLLLKQNESIEISEKTEIETVLLNKKEMPDVIISNKVEIQPEEHKKMKDDNTLIIQENQKNKETPEKNKEKISDSKDLIIGNKEKIDTKDNKSEDILQTPHDSPENNPKCNIEVSVGKEKVQKVGNAISKMESPTEINSDNKNRMPTKEVRVVLEKEGDLSLKTVRRRSEESVDAEKNKSEDVVVRSTRSRAKLDSPGYERPGPRCSKKKKPMKDEVRKSVEEEITETKIEKEEDTKTDIPTEEETKVTPRMTRSRGSHPVPKVEIPKKVKTPKTENKTEEKPEVVEEEKPVRSTRSKTRNQPEEKPKPLSKKTTKKNDKPKMEEPPKLEVIPDPEPEKETEKNKIEKEESKKEEPDFTDSDDDGFMGIDNVDFGENSDLENEPDDKKPECETPKLAIVDIKKLQTTETDDKPKKESSPILINDESNDVINISETDPLASDVETETKKPEKFTSISSISFDTEEVDTTNIFEPLRRSLRRRQIEISPLLETGRKRPRDSQAETEGTTDAKKRKMKGKRPVDVNLRKSIEEQKNKENVSSDEEEQKENDKSTDDKTESKPKARTKGKKGKKLRGAAALAVAAAAAKANKSTDNCLATEEDKDETLNKEKNTSVGQDSPAPSSDPETSRTSATATPTSVTKTQIRKKRFLGLELDPEAIISAQEDSGRNVRQSRRIAQLKIKEEAERRKLEEFTIIESKTQKKKKSKKDEDKDFKGEKKRKGTKYQMIDDDEEESEEEVVVTSKKKHKKKRKQEDLKRLFNISNAWKSSSDSSSSNEEEEEEEEVEEYISEDERKDVFKSDHEFSPESDIEDTTEVQPTRRARTVKKESDTEEPTDDQACQKCGKSDHPEFILLCDTCDNGWHCSCLRPSLFVIPEGDWFCPPCQHISLVSSLKKQLIEYDKAVHKMEMEQRRKERLAYVGISLDNVLPAKTEHGERKDKKEDESESESESASSESGSTSDSDSDEPIYQLRQRRQAHSYRFNDYDDLINSAIQEEVEIKGAGNQGRGKDISTIVNAEKEEQAKALLEAQQQLQPPDPNLQPELQTGVQPVPVSEEPEAEELPPVVPLNTDIYEPKEVYSDDDPPVVSRKKLKGRKKHRKLNSLEDESEDDADSDEDFKGDSGSEEEEFEEDLGSEDSEDSYGGRRRNVGTRRSTRARTTRFDRDFINDDSDDEPVRKKNRSIWDEESETESDKSWGRRGGRGKKTSTKREAIYPVKKRKKSKKKKKRNPDSDTEVKPKVKRPRIQYGGLDDSEEEVLTRRTRGKKITYIDTLGSDSEEERPKKSSRIIESEDEYVANEEDEEEDIEAEAEMEQEQAVIEDKEDSGGESGEDKLPVVPKKIIKLPKLAKIPKSPRARGRGRVIGVLQRQRIISNITISSIKPPPNVLDPDIPAGAEPEHEDDDDIEEESEEEDDEEPPMEDMEEEALNASGVIPHTNIPVIPANPEDLNEEEVGMMMEDEDFANKQLELMAIQLAKEKKKKELEAQQKMEVMEPIAPPMLDAQPKKRGRRKKFVEGTSPLKQQLQQNLTVPPMIISKVLLNPPVFHKEVMEQDKASIDLNLTPNPADFSSVPSTVQDLSLTTPPKRRGRGKGKKTLAAEQAAAAAAAVGSTPNQLVRPTSESPSISGDSQPTNSPEPGFHAGKLGIATPPQPFTQSQPTPSVITRMLQSQPVSAQSFSSAASAMNQKYFGGMEQSRGASNQFPGMGARGRVPSPYRQNVHGVNNFPNVRPMAPGSPHRLRSPGPPNMPQMFHSPHHPLDPSPSGGGHIQNPRDRQSPADATKGGPTPPPQAQYARGILPGMNRFPNPNEPPPGPSVPPVRPPTHHLPFPTQMQPESPPRPPAANAGGGNFSPYHPPPPPNYHYGAYPPPPSLTAADDALPPTQYQSSPYPEHYNPTDGVSQPSEGSNSNKPFDEEGSGEFGGLVSYFSSQREDDLDA